MIHHVYRPWREAGIPCVSETLVCSHVSTVQERQYNQVLWSLYRRLACPALYIRFSFEIFANLHKQHNTQKREFCFVFLPFTENNDFLKFYELVAHSLFINTLLSSVSDKRCEIGPWYWSLKGSGIRPFR